MCPRFVSTLLGVLLYMLFIYNVHFFDEMIVISLFPATIFLAEFF